MNESVHPSRPEHEASAAVQSPGSVLSAARQQSGWSVGEAASRLNLAPRQIEAIEANNWSALPGLATTRGFVRAYAKLMRLDSAPLVAALEAQMGHQHEAAPVGRPIAPATLGNASSSSNRRGRTAIGTRALAAAAFVVILLGLAWAAWQLGYFGSNSAQAPANPATSAVTPSPSATAPGMAAPSEPGVASTVLPAPVISGPQEGVQATNPATQSGQPQGGTAQAAAPNSGSATPGAANNAAAPAAPAGSRQP